jgi:hypothetical protein
MIGLAAELSPREIKRIAVTGRFAALPRGLPPQAPAVSAAAGRRRLDERTKRQRWCAPALAIGSAAWSWSVTGFGMCAPLI